MKGLIISGTGSGVGKTSITTGLMSRLSKTMKVQPFKVGPDFIDPMYHSAATGNHSRNLDTFMMGKDVIRNLVAYSSKDADIAIVEGVRGLYEGSTGTGDEGSTADIAKILGFPVVLVIDAGSLTRSAVAMVNGFRDFDKEIKIAGVIMNNVSGSQHERKLREAMEHYSDIEILGCVRKDKENSLEQRYLGLKTLKTFDSKAITPLEGLTESIDLDRLINAAEMHVPDGFDSRSPYGDADGNGLKVAVPVDEAYCFYYYDNIESMRQTGMDIIEFSPVNGDPLPNADIYYLGGGYPELFVDRISENKDFLQGLKNVSEEGRTVIGECGGLMTMCNNIVDKNGVKHKMSGVFDAEAKMSGVRHGPCYVIADPLQANPIFRNSVKGHEYHYSDVILNKEHEFGFLMKRGVGIDGSNDGLVFKKSLGTYMHQHALSSENWVEQITTSLK